MLLNRDHRGWMVGTVLLTLALVYLYLAKFHPALLPFRAPIPELGAGPGPAQKVGATPLGLGYGIAAYLIFLFAAALGLRKKVPLWRLGSAKLWLKAHIWLTVLTIPLVLMHADFKAGAPMTLWLLVLYAVVMASGFYGLALQQIIPRLMRERLQLETIFEQIPYLKKQLGETSIELRDELLKQRDQLKEAAAVPVAAVAAAEEKEEGEEPAKPAAALAKAPETNSNEERSLVAMLETLEREVIPYLLSRNPKRYGMAKAGYADEVFRQTRVATLPEHRENIDRMESWCEERRQMDLQSRFHYWLHGWLLVHVPTSLLLVVYTGWHAVVALFNY